MEASFFKVMHARDPHRYVNELGEEAVERLISRLESRAKDIVFTSLIDKYCGRLTLSNPAKVLEVGCGTGAMIRSFVCRDDFNGNAVAIDQSIPFIDAAKALAKDAGIEHRLHFQLGDAHKLDFQSASFDTVIANTLISHVSDTQRVLEEMARVVRPDGTIAIFDGDYASMTYAYPDYEFGRKMDNALAIASFNNPTVMRDLPRMLESTGLQIDAAWGDAVVEIGNGSYFKSFADTYAPYVASSGLMEKKDVDDWLAMQHQAIETGMFFASCNYYTYLLRRRLNL